MTCERIDKNTLSLFTPVRAINIAGESVLEILVDQTRTDAVKQDKMTVQVRANTFEGVVFVPDLSEVEISTERI